MSALEYRTILKYRLMIPLFPVDEPCPVCRKCMRTRRSYFPPTSTIPRRFGKQTTNVVEPEFRTIVEMADNRTMTQMLQAPIEGYEDAIVIPRECLSIIESKSKVRYSRSRITDVRANTNAPLPSSSPSNSFDLQQIAASLEDKLDIRMNRFEKSLNDMKNSFITPTAPLKVVEEVCVTCGANHSYNQCPLTRGNDFLVFHGRPLLSTAHAIINFHGREIIIRQDQQSLTIQCGDIPSIKKVERINKIDFIDAGGIDFESEEIENFLNNDSILFGVEDSPFNMDEEILFLESLLREDPIPPHPIILNQTKLPIEEPKHSFKMGHEHFNTNLVTNDVAESSTRNLIPIPHECEVVSENESQSTEPVHDNYSIFTTISNPLFDNNKINSDEINSHVESNSNESTSNHDTVKSDYLDEFYRPFIPIHILEEERIRREHADYINRMEMLFTINPLPHHQTNDNTNVESFSSLPTPIQESDSHQEEIDVVSVTDDVLHPSIENDDLDEEVDTVDVLRVDNFIQNSEYEYSKSDDSDFDNPPLPLPPPEPPDKGFDFEIKISVVRSVIVKFECIDARVKFDVFNDENDVLSYIMFVIFAKMFSFLST
uniref:Auxilin-like protein n=1 Tax=Tanacetum cinerariifolium TaxID=118510 RepID=A0A6L2LS95_TANCI|nr:auxilin-like protein [Tanacetum cinerariifolium]